MTVAGTVIVVIHVLVTISVGTHVLTVNVDGGITTVVVIVADTVTVAVGLHVLTVIVVNDPGGVVEVVPEIVVLVVVVVAGVVVTVVVAVVVDTEVVVCVDMDVCVNVIVPELHPTSISIPTNKMLPVRNSFLPIYFPPPDQFEIILLFFMLVK